MRSASEYSFHVVALTETWFTERYYPVKVAHRPNGYKLFDHSRKQRKGGGTASVCRSKIAFKRIDVYYQSLKFQNGFFPMIVHHVYVYPSFISLFTQLINL